MKKKLLSLLMVTALTASLVAGCDLTEIQKINHPVQTEKPKMYRSW